MKVIFADTHYWIALIHPKDPWKDAAKRAHKKIGRVLLITTDEVLTEFLNALHPPMLRSKAAQTVRQIMQNPNVRVIPQTRERFLAALDRYENRADKEYGLIDCASMNVMDAEGTCEILTHDHHFAQEGYTVLMRQQQP